KTQISWQEFEESVERVAMGPERKSRLIKEKEKRITAYHEGGHALVAKLLPDSDPVHKVTILPRGMAMGYVLSLPEDDRYMSSKSELMAKITMALGGRVAEEVVLGDITTGAESDLQYATELARRMICEFGMSENLGPLSLGRRHGPVFLGRDLYEERNYSEEVAAQIDKEIRALVEQCYARAKELIENNRDKLERIVAALLEKETIDGDELDAIVNGVERPGTPPPTAAAPIAPDVPPESEPRRTPQPRPQPGLAGA
ncbi:MAG: cell division protein FtsH, partial [Abditibacteriales bacterium]|nr:cell division protein FtsH [Abditibacteriales bacterium]